MEYRRSWCNLHGYSRRSGINDMELTRVHIHHEVDTSIRKLGLKHVNLYQIHGLDLLTTIDEIL